MNTDNLPPHQYRDVEVLVPRGITVAHAGHRIGDIRIVINYLLQTPTKDWDADEEAFMDSYLRYGDDIEELLEEHGCINMGGNFLLFAGEIH